ncbi:hypothetical protein CF319_g1908 [Tilletia indica]|nr:hypothetical protein CF319_g1908 [Tilletia indica]
MRNSLLRGVVEAAAIAANISKLAQHSITRSTPPPSSTTTPWPTQRQHPQQQEPVEVSEDEYTPAFISVPQHQPHPTPAAQQHRPQQPLTLPKDEQPATLPKEDVQQPKQDIPPPKAPSPPPAPITPQQSKPVSEPTPPPPTTAPPPPPPTSTATDEDYDPETTPRQTPLRAAKVPSSRLGRLMHYGSLGAGLAWGAAGQYISPSPGGSKNAFMGEANLRRLVDKLSTMRGAALKMGQFMSIQDSNMLPPELEEVLLRVQNSANYMPEWQMEKVMREDLGPEWRSNFDSFSPIPFAAASIGQVHSAILSSTHPSPLAGTKVAVKIQFPGIKQSIASDLGYLTTLLTASALLPRGLFLDKTIETMRGELEDECDYVREAEMGRRFARLLDEVQGPGKSSAVEGVMDFAVPRVVDDLCTGRVLTTEMMKGRPLTQSARYSQERRNQIATSILRLCLQELFQFRLMQTDPNWSNFLLNERTNTLELLDFGATREYSPAFIDKWFALLSAAVRGDRESCLEWSAKIGYLTGEESDAMLEAHLSSMLLLAEPFSPSSPSPYPFTNQTITSRVRSHIPVMLKERKTPPPKETYSLNRKLSGAFLLCARLGAEVPCREVWEEVAGAYRREVELASTSGGTNGRVVEARRGIHTLARGAQGRSVRQGPSELASPILSHPWIQRRLQHTPTHAYGRQRPLNLRATWDQTLSPRLPTSSQSRAKLELPQDPLGIESPTSGVEAPVLGPNKVAEETMKGALGQSEEGGGVKSGPKPVWIRGIMVPRKPPPPGPEDCCMSGCVHCTYDIYADAIQDYISSLDLARQDLERLEPALSEEDWERARELGIKRVIVAQQQKMKGKEKAQEEAQREVDEAVRNVVDPTLRAFLDMERRMKKKIKAEGKVVEKEGLEREREKEKVKVNKA